MDYKRYLKQLIDGDSTERKSKSNTEILKEIEAWQRQVGHTDSAEPDVGDEYNDEPLSISPTLELHRHLFVPVAQAKKNNELVQGSQVLKKILGCIRFWALSFVNYPGSYHDVPLGIHILRLCFLLSKIF
ncbi:hypothetical protein FRC02_005838 [Tulasnella sp. 418]|nr:hypothetical protein FRC02_005838 [Tulasnella sp. 418]